MGIKLGNLDISSFKVGGADCSIYLGDTLLYPQSQPQTLQWVTFSNGDTIPSDLQIYGIKGIVNDLWEVFNDYSDNILIEPNKNKYNAIFGGFDNPCYNEVGIASNTSVEYIFSNVGCSDSYTVSSKTIANLSNDIQLYIMEQPTPQCNVPATATWNLVNNNFNRNTPIYGVSFANGDVYGGGDYQLEVKNQSNIIYSIDCHLQYVDDDSDSDYITIYNNSDGSIYRQIDNTVVINSFCDVFGEPMYISDNAAIPSVEQCGEIDEETGECIDAYTEYFMAALY